MKLAIRDFSVPQRFSFAHASAERRETEALLVTASSADGGHTGLGEACPRPYVTGETVDSVKAFFTDHQPSLAAITDLAGLREWMATYEGAIDRNPSAFAALEGAIIDVLARKRGETLEQFLGLPPLATRHQYSAILGDARPWKFHLQATAYFLAGFRDFKVKLSGNADRDRRKLRSLQQLDRFMSLRIRADANNLWPDADACIRHVEHLPVPLRALEEPVTARDRQAQREIADRLGIRIILDESLITPTDLTAYADMADLVIANIRVSKNGGILRSMGLARRAEELGIPVIIGAHVGESSILSRAALTVATALGPGLMAQEGCFGKLLLKRDAVSPSLRFGYGGQFRAGRYPALVTPGSGLLPEPE